MFSREQRFLLQYILWAAGILLLMGVIAGISLHFSNPSRAPGVAPRFSFDGPSTKAGAPAQPDIEVILQRLDQAITDDPLNADLRAQRAKFLINARRITEAMVDATDALAINPSQPTALLAKGSILIMSGKPEDGLQCLDLARVSGAEPRHVDLLRAGGLRRAGQLDAANRVVTDLIATNPFDVPALILRTDIALSQGRFEDALQDIEGTVHTSPAPAAALVLRGIALVGLARWKEALASFGAAAELEPLNPTPALGIATASRALGDRARADEALSWAKTALPSGALSGWPESGSPADLALALLNVANRESATTGN